MRRRPFERGPMPGSHTPSGSPVAALHIAVRVWRTEVRNRGLGGQPVAVRTVLGGSLGAGAGHMRRTQRRECPCGLAMVSVVIGPCSPAQRREFRMQPDVRVVDQSSPRIRLEGNVVGQAGD